VALTSQAESIERDRPVIFFCHTGVRSLMAAEAFHRAGYEAYSMAGGIAAWDAAGLPVEPERDAVAGQ
jgi:rhodanese-related sulfurtransferase